MTTLRSVFKDVKVLPGEGLTFIASDVSYPFPKKSKVNNSFFDNLIISGLSQERLKEVNNQVKNPIINNVFHPYLLWISLENYLDKFNKEKKILCAIILLIFLFFIFIIKPTKNNISIGTTGFCVGIYSVALMFLYQSMNGTLYSHIAILTLALYLGFTVGSFIRNFPFSDLIIGLILGASLIIFSYLNIDNLIVFLFCNFMGGFLSSAQFVSTKTENVAILNAADCAGGVFGMALSSTLFIPLLGIKTVAIIIIIIKLLCILTKKIILFYK